MTKIEAALNRLAVYNELHPIKIKDHEGNSVIADDDDDSDDSDDDDDTPVDPAIATTVDNLNKLGDQSYIIAELVKKAQEYNKAGDKANFTKAIAAVRDALEDSNDMFDESNKAMLAWMKTATTSSTDTSKTPTPTPK